MRIGGIQKKVMVLLSSGLELKLSGSPRQSFRIIHTKENEWQGLSNRQIKNAIIALYELGVINNKQTKDGTICISLNSDGKSLAKKYALESIQLNTSSNWDERWRMVIFNIPEENRKLRDDFRQHIKRLGFYELKNSVWVYPFDCLEEIQQLIKFYKISKQVHIIESAIINNDLFLKKKFRLT